MALAKLVTSGLKSPIWIAQLFTSAKSFLDNPILGSPTLNRLGLHRTRVTASARLCAWRRGRLAKTLPGEWRQAFERDGFVVVPDFLPQPQFARLQHAILDYRAPAREMRQGDAITRRMAVDPAMLRAVPDLRALLGRHDLRALFDYVASYRGEPLHYVQTIVTHAAAQSCGEYHPDPQETLHCDAFHSSLKSWFFLNDLPEDEAPFVYVPGSHRLTPERLQWEYARSIRSYGAQDRLSARGSPRIAKAELPALGLPEPLRIAARANTLVVADMFGFHARGSSARATERLEVWSYSRRNPFLPWISADPMSLPGLAERRVRWLWALRDRFAASIGQPWRPVGVRGALDGKQAGDG